MAIASPHKPKTLHPIKISSFKQLINAYNSK